MAAAPRAQEPSLSEVLANHYLSGATDLRTRKHLPVLLIILLTSAVVGLAGIGVTIIAEIRTAEPRAEADQAANRRTDLAKTPFTGTADYDTSLPDFWRIGLDRTLTREEQAALEAIPDNRQFSRKVWDLLRPLGGRLHRFAPTMETPPADFDQGAAYWGDTTVFKLNLFSERTTQLSITDMRAVNVSCRAPTAKTVVEYSPQGGAAYEGVLFDLTSTTLVPYITEPGADQGQPYFSRRKIDLGGGASPGGLRVESLALDKSCSWEIRAQYRDSTQKDGEVILRDGDKPFFAEALPRVPIQYWTYHTGRQNGPPLAACHERPDVPPCKARTERG